MDISVVGAGTEKRPKTLVLDAPSCPGAASVGTPARTNLLNGKAQVELTISSKADAFACDLGGHVEVGAGDQVDKVYLRPQLVQLRQLLPPG